MKQYASGKALKMTEEDTYNEGCLPETSTSYEVDIQFNDGTKEGLLNKMQEYFDITKDDMLINSCDENGRIDIQVLENSEGCKASDRELAQWKSNNLTLWLACYSYQVKEVITSEVIF